MSSTSSSSYGDGPQTNSKPLEKQFESFTIEESNSIVQNDEATAEPQLESSFNGSLDDNGNHEEFNALEERIEVGSEVRGIGDSGDGVVWRRTNSELKVDGPSSPSSSGYAGERGSSSVTSASRIGEVSEDEIQEAGNDSDVDGNLDSQAAWVPGKRHVDEDDASISWRKRKKHFFILSHSGKPIYSRYGDEHKLAGFSATLQAIISFVENGGIVSNWLGLESTRTSESFSPICLPRYNPLAFLYAYVHYLDVDTYLMLLTTSSDAFYHLKDCRIRIEMVLLKSNVLSEVQRSMLDGGMRVEDLPGDPLPRSGTASPHLGQHKLPTDHPERFRESYLGIGGPAGLWHFMYRSISGSICIF
ncbi:hypothetical protein GH714_028818 [Hevea brasiliensis]|uniref:Vacuolar fusion protein MON1 homolog n=1 Tax=Hevea brasiliensis TaxID=3981 RepID=A0A6A6KB15_HEVBR|nr:hypothetical protein GH714_028818 [Hevea brasiliensis]